MDANVSLRFFRIQKPDAQSPAPDIVLKNLFNRELKDREIALDEGVLLRLERYEPEATYRVGEFCRIQKTNIPPSAGPDGLIPTKLEGDRGLGHLAAFRYHVPTNVFLLQINMQCATPKRISAYFGQAEQRPLYVLKPVFRRDALLRMQKGEVRSFTVAFAEPENLAAFDDPRLSVLKGTKQAARLFHAHEIEITISAGSSRKRHLTQMESKRILSKLSRTKGVSTLMANVKEGNKTIPLDLLEDQLKHSEVLDLPSDNPLRNYEMRKTLLTNTFNANLAELTALFGPKNDAG